MEATIPEEKAGLALKLGFYIFIAWIGLPVFGFVLGPLGYLIAAAGSVFGSAIVANSLAIRTFERLPIASVGLGWTAVSGRNLRLGVLMGIGAATSVTFVPLVLGLAELQPDPDNPASASAALFVSLVLLFGAIGEELLFRGYGFQMMIRLIGPAGSLAITAILFGLVHRMNPNASTLGIVNTAGFGILLGYAFLRTGELWLPIGIHFGWNWLLPVAGVHVSGFKMGLTGYALHWKVSEVWSGGAYGPEASVLTCLVVLALMVLIWRMPLRSTQALLLVPPRPGKEV